MELEDYIVNIEVRCRLLLLWVTSMAKRIGKEVVKWQISVECVGC